MALTGLVQSHTASADRGKKHAWCFIHQCAHVTGTEAHTQERDSTGMGYLIIPSVYTDRFSHIYTNCRDTKNMNEDIRTTTLLKYVYTDSQTSSKYS